MGANGAFLSGVIGFGILSEGGLFGNGNSIFGRIFVFELVDFVCDAFEFVPGFKDRPIH